MLNELSNDVDKIMHNFTENTIKVEKQFKVGDRVQFKTWEEMEKEFGTCEFDGINTKGVRFVTRMKHLCGTYATIIGINSNNIVLLSNFTANGDIDWDYSIDMLKHVENEPKWVFTEDEKAILRNIDESYKYITRDNFGDLELYAKEPEKSNNTWMSDGDSEYIKIFNNIFKCIQWTDEEPCEFRKYI